MVPGNGWQLGKFIVDIQNQSCREIWREEEKTVHKKPAANRKVVKKPAANVQMAVDDRLGVIKKPAANDDDDDDDDDDDRLGVIKKPAANVQMAVIGKKPAAKIEVKKQVEKKPATKTQTTKKNMAAKRHPAA